MTVCSAAVCKVFAPAPPKVGNTKFGDQRKRAVTFVKMLLFSCNNL